VGLPSGNRIHLSSVVGKNQVLVGIQKRTEHQKPTLKMYKESQNYNVQEKSNKYLFHSNGRDVYV